MNPKIVCNECGTKGLSEYRMVLMMGPKGYRQYSICLRCADGKPLKPKRSGGRQMATKVKRAGVR